MNVKAVTPILNVSDMQQSFSWFEKIGWKKSWAWGSPASFGGVCSGKNEIFICLNGQGGRGKGSNHKTFNEKNGEVSDKGVWLSLWVDNVDIIYKDCVKQGIEIMHEPENMPWNVRELHIRHPDGHIFRVSQGIEKH
ncbi:MAG: bleomycin resistance family protein [Verrucomicrobiota bacterium]